MKNKKLIFIASILAAVFQIFGLGTLIYFAVDVFALYSENQFTGRMRSFDVDYWNAVGGVAILTLPARLMAAFTKKMKQVELDRQSDEFVSEYSDVIEGLEKLFNDRAVQDGTPRWEPPKNPPKL